MTKEQLKVKEFHEKFGLTINERPTIPLITDQRLRDRLIREETSEFHYAQSIDDIADALGDLLYVVYGAAVTYGIDLEPIFDEIHRSNMTKLQKDGTVKKNEFGKVIKPDHYSPANIQPLIEEQMK